MDDARERLALLADPARSLEPGRYRAYLAPAAMEELAGMLCWGGFSGRALATRQSCLFRMQDGAATLDPVDRLRRKHRRRHRAGVPGRRVRAARQGAADRRRRLVGSLVSPRTAREFALATNGANAYETPEALDMAAGELPVADALAALDTGLYVGNLRYLNFSDRPACRVTGMTRFASFWVENGRIVAPVDVMRFDDSVYRMLGDHLVGLTAERELIVDSNTYRARNVGSMRLPGALVSRDGVHALTLSRCRDASPSGSLPAASACTARAGCGRSRRSWRSRRSRPSFITMISSADVLDDGEVVRDEDVGQVEFVLQVLQQVQHLRLHRHVERRHRLVADQDVGLHRQAARDRDPLPLAAGEFVRVLVERDFRQADLLQQLEREVGALLRGCADAVDLHRLGQDLPDGEARIERRVRILEDDLDAPLVAA